MIIYNDNLDLTQIANSGQCFRWVRVNNRVWKFPICDIWYRAWHDENNHSKIHIVKENGSEVDSELVNHYFDIDTDYHSIIEEIPQDDLYLKNAAEKYSGIRILRQDLWEMIISFIISQKNNIPRIKKSIEKICNEVGGRFPTFRELEEMDLSDKGLGYRDKYIKAACDFYSNWTWFEEKTPNRTNLLEIYGVGNKVADCICLFGLHQLDACPIDTWIKKIINARYNGIQPEWMKGKYAGIFQQYVFAYERSLHGDK